MKPTNFKFVLCSLRVSAHIMVPFTLTVSLKSGWGSWTRTNESGSQSPLPYHLAIPQYTNRFIHPTYCSRYGLRGLYFLQEAYMEASSSCAISLILDVTLPTRLGLWPIALRLPLFTSAILHLFSSVSLSHFQRTRTQAISFSFRIVGQSF